MCITCGVKEESSGGLPQPGSSQPHLSPPHHLQVIWQPLGTRSPGPVGGGASICWDWRVSGQVFLSAHILGAGSSAPGTNLIRK